MRTCTNEAVSLPSIVSYMVFDAGLGLTVFMDMRTKKQYSGEWSQNNPKRLKQNLLSE